MIEKLWHRNSGTEAMVQSPWYTGYGTGTMAQSPWHRGDGFWRKTYDEPMLKKFVLVNIGYRNNNNNMIMIVFLGGMMNQ